MAAARQRADWLRVGVAVSWIINRNGFTKEPVSPLAIIPEQFHPVDATREPTPEEQAEASRLGWAALDHFFSKG